MTYSFSLQVVSLVIGAMLILLGLAAALRPAQTGDRLKSFPRARIPGVVLTGIALLWSAWLLNKMPMGGLSAYKWLLYILTPLSFYLIVFYMEELLAARATGAILMLIPAMIFDAGRWHDSPTRLLMIMFGYILAVAGMWIVLSPHKFRVWTTPLVEHPAVCRTAGWFSVILGGVIALTALTSY